MHIKQKNTTNNLKPPLKKASMALQSQSLTECVGHMLEPTKWEYLHVGLCGTDVREQRGQHQQVHRWTTRHRGLV